MNSAKIRLQLAFMLVRDVQAWRNGDAARFDRMVNGHGKSVLSPQNAVENIKQTCEAVEGDYPVTARFLLRWAGGGK